MRMRLCLSGQSLSWAVKSTPRVEGKLERARDDDRPTSVRSPVPLSRTLGSAFACLCRDKNIQTCRAEASPGLFRDVA